MGAITSRVTQDTDRVWGFLVDVHGVQQRDVVGVDKLTWGSDFPHSATDWPNSSLSIEQNFAGVPEDDRGSSGSARRSRSRVP